MNGDLTNQKVLDREIKNENKKSINNIQSEIKKNGTRFQSEIAKNDTNIQREFANDMNIQSEIEKNDKNIQSEFERNDTAIQSEIGKNDVNTSSRSDGKINGSEKSNEICEGDSESVEVGSLDTEVDSQDLDVWEMELAVRDFEVGDENTVWSFHDDELVADYESYGDKRCKENGKVVENTESRRENMQNERENIQNERGNIQNVRENTQNEREYTQNEEGNKQNKKAEDPNLIEGMLNESENECNTNSDIVFESRTLTIEEVNDDSTDFVSRESNKETIVFTSSSGKRYKVIRRLDDSFNCRFLELEYSENGSIKLAGCNCPCHSDVPFWECPEHLETLKSLNCDYHCGGRFRGLDLGRGDEGVTFFEGRSMREVRDESYSFGRFTTQFFLLLGVLSAAYSVHFYFTNQ